MRLRKYAAIVAATVILTGCGDGAKPTATPSLTKSVPQPLPTQDFVRLACHTMPSGMLEQLEKLAEMRQAAEYAVKSAQPQFGSSGTDLLNAVNDREIADLNGDHNAAVDANLAMSRAALELAENCAARYGDGPW